MREPKERATFSLRRPTPMRVKGLRQPMVKNVLVTAFKAPRFKLIAYTTAMGRTYQLYNLSKDPKEQHDIALENPELVNRMGEKITRCHHHTSRGTKREPQELSPDTQEALRALGYLD